MIKNEEETVDGSHFLVTGILPTDLHGDCFQTDHLVYKHPIWFPYSNVQILNTSGWQILSSTLERTLYLADEFATKKQIEKMNWRIRKTSLFCREEDVVVKVSSKVLHQHTTESHQRKVLWKAFCHAHLITFGNFSPFLHDFDSVFPRGHISISNGKPETFHPWTSAAKNFVQKFSSTTALATLRSDAF